MASRIYEGAVGIIFRPKWRDEDEAVINIELATTIEIEFRKPDGTKVLKDCIFPGGGTDGFQDYVTIANDLLGQGPWRAQGHFISPTQDLWGPVHRFRVVANLTDLTA